MDFVNLGVLFSQLGSILFFLNDLCGDVRSGGSAGGSTSNISLDGESRNDTAVVRDRRRNRG